MKRDPRIRKDGTCAHCRGERRVPQHPQKGIDPAIYLGDAFCSTECCRAYHDNPLPPLMSGFLHDGGRRGYEVRST